jgi:hypothetical protein
MSKRLAAWTVLSALLAASPAAAGVCHAPPGLSLQQWFGVCGAVVQQDYAVRGPSAGMSFQNFVLATYQIYLRSELPAAGAPPPVVGGGAGMLCSPGASQCFNGWLRTCQRMATGGSWWVTSAQQCR